MLGNNPENLTRARRIPLRLHTDMSLKRIGGPVTSFQRTAPGMLALLFVLSLSYWYCLPVITQSFFTYSEVRGYDILLAILILVLVGQYRRELQIFFKQDTPGRWLFRFSVWATATFPVTVFVSIINYRYTWPFVTLVFLFHLWGYLLAYAAFRIFVNTRKQCYLLLDAFLVAGTVVAIVICLQGIGIVPRFWSELYDVYGNMTFSATLGPNRAMPGHTMILTLAVVTAYWRNVRAVGIRRIWLASVAAVASLAALGMTGSRTAWTTLIAFILAVFVLRRPSLGVVFLLIISGLGIAVAVPSTVKERIGEMYDYRIEGRLQQADSDDYLDQFQTVDANRYNIWVAGIRELAFSYPWLIPFGGGFNSYRINMSVDNSAHNIYITLIAEVGIVGLLLYLAWLKGIWRESANLISAGSKLAASQSAFVPVDLQALVIAMLVSLIGGEILYPYRPSFAFMGMFLFLCAVMNHRALVLGDRNQTQLKPAIRTHPIVSTRKGKPVRPHESIPGFSSASRFQRS